MDLKNLFRQLDASAEHYLKYFGSKIVVDCIRESKHCLSELSAHDMLFLLLRNLFT